MKKLLILTLVLFVLSLSACSLNKDNRGEEKLDQTNQSNIVGGDRDEHGCIGSAGYSWCEIKQQCLRVWEESCEANNLETNESISSEKLGIEVSYYSNPENETGSKIEGNRIYFYMNGPVTVSDYESGQYLEEFTKEVNSSLQSAIENKFLQNINKDKCFVEIIEDTAEYQKAIINYPNTPCSDGSPDFNCSACPAGYSRTNGISYFIYYKNHPNLYFYFSIGQYSLVMGASQATANLEWFNNIEFLK